MATAPITIYDQFGRSVYGDAFKPPTDPLASSSAVKADAGIVFRDVPITAMTGQWTIDRIREALQTHKIGQFQESADLCDSIFGDERVQATLGSRTGGLFSQPIKFTRAKDGREFSHRSKHAWKRCWKKLGQQSVLSEIMRWVIAEGFALAEVLWDRTVAPWQPYLKVWHPRFATYRYDLRQYQVITMDGPVAAVPGTGKWLLFTPHGPYRGWMQGAVRAVSDKWFIKQLAWRDWARFNERHGLPIIKATVPAAGDAVQKANFVAGMKGIGQSAVVGLPQNVDGTGYDISLLEARDRAWESFKGTIDRCDMSIVLPILWQNLTTEVKEGSFAAARVHGDVRQNAIEFDNETLGEAIYRDIARPWALFNFGDPDVAPMTSWNVRPFEDYVMRADALVKLANAMNQLRQAGVKVVDPQSLALLIGLPLGALEEVDPTQIEAKLAAAPSQSTKLLRAEVRSLRHELRAITRDFEARMAA